MRRTIRTPSFTLVKVKPPSSLTRPFSETQPISLGRCQRLSLSTLVKWKSQGHHLDVVASADALRLPADRLPPRDPIEDSRDVLVIGEIVKGPLGRGT